MFARLVIIIGFIFFKNSELKWQKQWPEMVVKRSFRNSLKVTSADFLIKISCRILEKFVAHLLFVLNRLKSAAQRM